MSIEAATELHFADVGGRAGGVKAVHKRQETRAVP